MRKRGDLPKRGEVKEKNEKCRMDMKESEVNLDKLATDVETVRKTLESLVFYGTDEGSRQVKKHIEGAEDVTKEVFSEEDEHLEQIQGEGQIFEKDLKDMEVTSEKDLGKLSDSSVEVKTTETINELIKAKEAILVDLDFLKEQIVRAHESRERSDQIKKELKSKVFSGRSGNEKD